MYRLRTGLFSFALLTPFSAVTAPIDSKAFFVECNQVLNKNAAFFHRGAQYNIRRAAVLESPGRQTIERLFALANERWNDPDRRYVAYILGTAYRESMSTMQPLREGRCSSTQCVVDAVYKLMERKPEKYKENYALPNAEGHSYYGRGLVQLTGENNYKKLGEKLKINLISEPDKALDLDTSLRILLVGMDDGLFTDGKHTLRKYFREGKTDWINARKIVNPGSMDNAPITGGYAQIFMRCMAPPIRGGG